jgi:hypothetical protein
LNYEPVHGMAGNRTADFASEFLKRGHEFFHCGTLGLLNYLREFFDIK